MLCRVRSVLYSVEFRVWVWEGPLQDQVFRVLIPRIVLQGPSQNAGFYRLSQRCSIFPGAFCKFNPPIFYCLASLSKDDCGFSRKTDEQNQDFPNFSALLASLVAPRNPLNATVVSKMQGCFKRGSFPIWTRPHRFLSLLSNTKVNLDDSNDKRGEPKIPERE